MARADVLAAAGRVRAHLSGPGVVPVEVSEDLTPPAGIVPAR
jgi:hypothetical protein